MNREPVDGMSRRHFVAVATTASLAGCTGIFDGDESGTLDLTVQNERADPVDVQVDVVDDEGTTYEATAARIDGGVARGFEVSVGSTGRHEVSVSGDDWRGQLAWNAETCLLFDGHVRVTDEGVSVAGECTRRR